MPMIVYSKPTEILAWVNADTNKSLSHNLTQISPYKGTSGIQKKTKFDNFTINTAFNLDKTQKLTFDHSYIEYKNKNKTIGIGKINRSWSFSPFTSLILSSNAPPSNSFYLVINKNKKSSNTLFSMFGPWSIEIFNSFTSDTAKTKNPMLLGTRLAFEPVQNLKLELIKTSQWGGNNNDKDFSSFTNAVIGNTNENKHSNINQMAGFGFSYLSNPRNIPFKIYSQFIGEDEAGNLPSCFISLIGTTIDFGLNRNFSEFGFEYVDTRIDKTTNGNCGANTAYNNGSYDYVNDNISMGAQIDSESKSSRIWASSRLSDKLKISYSIRFITINDTNWTNHRLSSIKKRGHIIDIGAHWNINLLKINSTLTYQDLYLDRAGSQDRLNLSINTIYEF